MGTALARSAPSKQNNQQGPDQGQAVPAKQNTGVMGTLGGWWDSGTSWLGRKYDQASDAVSSTYNSVKQTVGDFADIYQNSDLSWKNGKFSASTDMDEVMDVLPEDIRKRYQLDKSNPAANKVTLEMDTNTGKLTLKIPNLQLNSLDLGGVKVGKTSLSGVVLSMDGAGGVARDFTEKKAGGWVADKVFGKQSEDQKKKGFDTNSSLKIAKVLATDVVHAQSKMKASALEVNGLSVSIFNQGGGLPGLDERPDQLRMDFSATSASVRGLSTPTTQAGDLSLGGVSGNLDQRTETADLSVASISTTGLVQDGQRLGSGRIENLSAHIDNKGGGLPFIDKQEDHLNTHVKAGSVSATNVNTSAAKLKSASISNLDANIDTTGPKLKTSGSIGTASVNGLDTDTVDADALKVNGGSWNHGSNGSSGAIKSASATNISQGNNSVGSLDVKDASGGRTQDGTIHASIGSVDASKIKTGGTSINTASVNGVNATHKGTTTSGSVKGAQATGIKADLGNGSSLKVDSAQASNLGASHNSAIKPTATNSFTAPSVGQVAGAVQNANLRGSIPLNEGNYGQVKVDPNTHANVSLNVNNGMVDPKTSRVDIDHPLDGPLWVDVKGAYLDDAKDGRAKLRANLGGAPDTNISDKLPGGQKTVPLSLTELAKMAPGQKTTATPSTNSTPATTINAGNLSASGVQFNSTSPNTQPKTPVSNSKKKDMSQMADLGGSSFSGNVGLKSGKTDLGSIKADLMREDGRDNNISVGAQQGGQNLALEFTRLLVGSFKLDLGGTKAESGRTAVSDGNLTVDQSGGSKQVNGSIGNVTVENLGIKK
jgi:hypothetical protein